EGSAGPPADGCAVPASKTGVEHDRGYDGTCGPKDGPAMSASPLNPGVAHDYRPVIAITMGDPAGIGAEVIVKALADPILRHRARYIIYGMNELLAYAADRAEYDVFWWRDQFNGRLRSYQHAVVVVD